MLRRTVVHRRQGQLWPAVVGPQVRAEHRHLIGERIGDRTADARELSFGDVGADTDGGEHGRHLVMALVVNGDRQADRIEVVELNPLEDPMQQRHQLRMLARLKVGRGHRQSRVTTVATRSRPEMFSSVMIVPVAGTINPSLVVAATANNARTAALSQ